MNILQRSTVLVMATAAIAVCGATPIAAGGERDGASEQKAAAAANMDRSMRTARLSEPASGSAHAQILVIDVQQGLNAAGIAGVDAGQLSLGTVQRLSQVFARRDGGQRAEAIAILDQVARDQRLDTRVSELPDGGRNAMVTVADVTSLGIDEDELGSLTLGQLLQISSTLSQHEGAVDRELAIRALLTSY